MKNVGFANFSNWHQQIPLSEEFILFDFDLRVSEGILSWNVALFGFGFCLLIHLAPEQ